MSDGSLSQDEIDALLQGAEDLSSDTLMSESGVSTAPTPSTSGISELDKTSLSKILDIESEAFSATMSTIISKNVVFSNPVVTEKSREDLRSQFVDNFVNTRLDFNSGVIGDNLFVMKKADAFIIANAMMNQGEDGAPSEFDELYQSAFTEAMSQMNGASITNITNLYNKNIRVTPPKAGVIAGGNNLLLPDSDSLVEVAFTLSIEGSEPSVFYQIMSMTLAKDFIALVGGNSGPAMSFQKKDVAPNSAGSGITGVGMPQQPMGAPVQPTASIQQPNLPNLADQLGIQPEQAANINLLLDVPMQLTVELGRTRMLIKDILGLGEGSILELDKLAGEPVDVLVNNKLIAKGEVVVIDENFGVRITDIISPIDRINNMQ